MYARHLAMFCLLSVSTFTARADSGSPLGTTLEVYVKGGQASTPDVLAAMSRELYALMQTAGFRVIMRGTDDFPTNGGAEHLVLVELRGLCVAQFSSLAAAPLHSSVPLASSAVADGRVLPFSSVDCAALNRFLAPVASNQTQAEQDYLYGRSLARLLAHEFYHILAQTDDHAPAGIAKARFSIADLLADHLDFETIALDRLHPPSTIAADDALDAGR
jgi:hypothetical protein